ncbi:MAG TPA: biotin/lipoyl-containing protein [Phototrophicaceae bacterium]|nr:biotin/lipoyl-containing protein [Phototrophicaceae bacterium]
MKHEYDYNGQPVSLELHRLLDGRYTAVIGERTLAVDAQPLPNGGWLLTLDGQQVVVHAATAGSERYVAVNGQHYTLTLPEKTGSRRQRAAGTGDLTAPMPGQIVDVLVQVGDRVERGQTLLILEAMKMEIRVTAPGTGRVKQLRVQRGDVVERGQLLAEIEAEI